MVVCSTVVPGFRLPWHRSSWATNSPSSTTLRSTSLSIVPLCVREMPLLVCVFKKKSLYPLQVSTGDEGNFLMTLFPHHTFRCKDGDGLVAEARKRPQFDGTEDLGGK